MWVHNIFVVFIIIIITLEQELLKFKIIKNVCDAFGAKNIWTNVDVNICIDVKIEN